MKVNWRVLIICIALTALAAIIGSFFTDIGPWYDSMKTSITPPNYVFPIVWTILFFLIAVSMYFAWLSGENKKSLVLLYGINLLLNILWSVLFFQLKNPLTALFELVILWLSIASLIFFNWEKSRKAAYLLVPYLVWVTFAGILNYLIIAK